MIYSMVGVMQIGLSANIIEASSSHNDGPQQIVQLDDRAHHDNERQREHDKRQRQENERHEREMRRHKHESEREWHERQERESRRHRDANDEIEAFLIGLILGSANR